MAAAVPLVRCPTKASVSVVTMFHPGDPGSQGAFDAAQVLAQQSGS
jgi:hypothetical protein